MTSTQRGALGAAIIGSATVFLDGSIVNIALPRIGATLPAINIGVLEGQVYVVAGYMATLAAFLLVAGALGDRYGMRRIFVIGLAGFGVTSILCGLSPTLDILAVARLLQGVAGSLLVPGSLALITAMFDGPERARAFGIWASATSGLAIAGPPIGGALVEAFGWRSIFLINGPLLAVGLFLALRYLPDLRSKARPTPFDWIGAAVGIVAVGGLSFGAIRGQEVAWSEPAAAHHPRDRRPRPDRLPDPDGHASQPAGAAVALPEPDVQRHQPLDAPDLRRPLRPHLRQQPLPPGRPRVLAAGLGDHRAAVRARPRLAVGPGRDPRRAHRGAAVPGRRAADHARRGAVVAAGAGQLYPVAGAPGRPRQPHPPAGALTDPLPAMLLFGIGISMVVAPLTSTLMSSAPVERAGLASAINNALSRVGQPLLSAGIFILITDRFYASLASRVPGLDPASPALRGDVQPLNAPGSSVDQAIADAARLASTEAFQATMLVVAGLLLAGAVVNWVGLRSGVAAAVPSGDRPLGSAGAG